MENIDKASNSVLAFLKLPQNILLAVSVATGLAAFLPNNLMKMLGLLSLRESKWFGIVGGVFILSVSLLAVGVLWRFGTKQWNKHVERVAIRKVKKWFKTVADGETINVIWTMFVSPGHELSLPFDGAIANNLVSHTMITRTAGTQAMGYDMSVKFMLQPWVVEWLQMEERNASDDFKVQIKKLRKQVEENKRERVFY